MWRRQTSRTIVVGTAVVIFVVCSVLPLAYLLGSALTAGSAPYAVMLLDARQRGLLLNTTALGLGVSLLATTIGVPLGITLARVPIRRKPAVRLTLAIPVLLPPYVMALAWVHLGGSYTLAAAIVLLGLVFYPLSMLATEVAIRRVDGRLEEAALVVAPPSRVLARITLPLGAPGVVAAALVIFVLAISEFGVPAVLRVRVYTTEVFTAFAALYDFNRAILLAIPLLLLCIVVAAAATALLGERLVAGQRSAGVSPVVFHAWRTPAQILVLLLIAVGVGSPAVILGREAMGTRSVAVALAGSREAIATSLLLSAIGATAVVIVAVWLGYARAREGGRLGRAADILFVVLFAVPSTIVGVGLIGLWNRPGPIGLMYGTDGMLLVVYLARFVPLASLILAAVTRTVPMSHEEAAAVCGAGWLRTMSRIVLPQIRLGIGAVWVITFVLAFAELGASIVVAPPGETTLPIRIYTMIANAPPSSVALLALLQTVVILTPLTLLGAAAWFRPTR